PCNSCNRKRERVLTTSAFDPAAFPDSPYAEELRRGFRWLRFPRAMERSYLSFHVANVRARVRVFLAIFPFIVIAEWLKDGVRIEEIRSAALELLLVALFVIASNWLAWSRNFIRLYLPIITPVAALVLGTAVYEVPSDSVTDGIVETLVFVVNVPLMTHLF